MTSILGASRQGAYLLLPLWVAASSARAAPTDPYALPLQLPAPPVRIIRGDPRIPALKARISRGHIFAAYRELAAIYEALGRYEAAAAIHRDEARQYQNKGLLDAAIIENMAAAQDETVVGLFLDRPSSVRELRNLNTGAAAEPPIGCYLGVHTRSDLQDLAHAIGRPHGSCFIYRYYGDACPVQWIRQCKAQGVVPQISWEPRDLNEVRDDAYLQSFARACGELNWPIFIRFACEMNGNWTPWAGQSALYKQKFRLVHRVLHQHAPLIATIWCVANPPLTNIEEFYPGDDGCDWVGVNFYSVPFHNNNPARPAFKESPVTLLDPIYQKYAAHKPIAVCEFAASHLSPADWAVHNDFAVNKMSLLYGALPRLYPRVKLIDWFDINMLRGAEPGKTSSNYLLTEQKPVLEAYRYLTNTPYFLSRYQLLTDPPPTLPRPFRAGQPVSGVVRFSVYCSTYVQRPRVYFKVGAKIVYAANRPGLNLIDMDTTTLPPGAMPVTVYIYDEQNRFITSIDSSVLVSRTPVVTNSKTGTGEVTNAPHGSTTN